MESEYEYALEFTHREVKVLEASLKTSVEKFKEMRGDMDHKNRNVDLLVEAVENTLDKIETYKRCGMALDDIE